MKSKPTKSKNSFQVLHPASLGIKKSKSGKNDLKKKVRFNLKVNNSPSEDMLYQKCLHQHLFRAECSKAFELKSQSNIDVTGCSKMYTDILRRSSSCLSNIFHPDNFLKLYRKSENEYQIVGLENGDLLRHLFNLQNNLPRKGILKHKCTQKPGKKFEATFQSYGECCEKKIGSQRSPAQVLYLPLEEQVAVSSQKNTTEILILNHTTSIFSPISNEATIGKDVFGGTLYEELTSSINGLQISDHKSSELLIPKTDASKQMLMSVNLPFVYTSSNHENLKLKIINSYHKENCYKSSTYEKIPWTDTFIHNSNSNANSSGLQNTISEISTQDQNHNNQTAPCSTFRETSDQGRNGLPSEHCKSTANQSGNSTQSDGHTIDHLNVGIDNHFSRNVAYQGKMLNLHSPRVLSSSLSSKELSFPSHVKEVVLKSQSEKLISKHATNLVFGKVTCQPSMFVRSQIGALNLASEKIHHFIAHQNEEESQIRTSDLSAHKTIIMTTSGPDYKKQVNCEKQMISPGVHYGSDRCHSKEISYNSNVTNKNFSCDTNSTSGILYRCPVLNCSVHFSNQELLLKHLSTMKHAPCHPMSTLINGTLPYQKPNFLCPLCGNIFLDKDKCFDHMLRQNHFRLMSPVSFLVFSCPQCLCFFQSLSKTLQHMDDLNHYNTAFSFEDDRENLNRASPIPVPYRLVVELIARCEKVMYILYCQDCHRVLESPEQLKAHVKECHMVMSKCCTNITDVFSSLITDQACTECHQYIYQGLPMTGLCIHTDCPLQGPILALRARNLKEFILLCGITDINVATENNLDTNPNICASVSETCTIYCFDSFNGKAHRRSSQFYDVFMSEQSSRITSCQRFKNNVEIDESQRSYLTRISLSNTSPSTSERTLAALAMSPAPSYILHNNFASTSLPTETFKTPDKEKLQTNKTACLPSEGTSQQVYNSFFQEHTSAVERCCCSSDDYLQPTCSSNFSKQDYPSNLSPLHDSTSSDSIYKCSATEAETHSNCREINSSSGNGVAANEDFCSCSNCQSSCSSLSCTSESLTSCESLTEVGRNSYEKFDFKKAFQSVTHNMGKVSSRYQYSIFERESHASLESEQYKEKYVYSHHSPRGQDEINEIYTMSITKPINLVHEATPALKENSLYIAPEALGNNNVGLFLGQDQITSHQSLNNVDKEQSQKPSSTNALQIESDMDIGQPIDSALFPSDSIKNTYNAIVKRKQDEDLEMPYVKKLKLASQEGNHGQTDGAFKTIESFYMLVRGNEDSPKKDVSFYTIASNCLFKKNIITRRKNRSNRKYYPRNGSKTRAFQWKPQFTNVKKYCKKNKIHSLDQTILAKNRKKEVGNQIQSFGKKKSSCLEQEKMMNICKNVNAQGSNHSIIDTKRNKSKNSKGEKKCTNSCCACMHGKKNNCQEKQCSLPDKFITKKHNSHFSDLTRKQAKTQRRQIEKKVSKNLNNCRTSKLSSKTTESDILAQREKCAEIKWSFSESGFLSVKEAADCQGASTSNGNKTDVKVLESPQMDWEQSSEVDIDEIKDRFFIVNGSLPFDESNLIIDDGLKLKILIRNANEKNKFKFHENGISFDDNCVSDAEESSANVDQNCSIKTSSPEVKFNVPVLRSSKARIAKNGFVLLQNNLGISKTGKKSILINEISQPQTAVDQVILRPQDKYMAKQHMRAATSTVCPMDDFSIVISDDDQFVTTVRSHINENCLAALDHLYKNLHGPERKENFLAALGKRRFSR